MTTIRCPRILTIEEAIAAQEVSYPGRFVCGAAMRLRDRFAVRCNSKASCPSAARSIFIWKRSAPSPGSMKRGGVAVHSSTQHPSETQEVVARVLGIGRHQVTVECLRMGGAFGGKEVQANPWAAIAALGAWKTKTARRVSASRGRSTWRSPGKRHPFLARYRAGFDSDGSLRGVESRFIPTADGASIFPSRSLARACSIATTPICLPALDLTGYVCRTHKTSQTAFRGFGGPQGMLVIEEILDQAARALYRFRRRSSASAISIAKATRLITGSR